LPQRSPQPQAGRPAARGSGKYEVGRLQDAGIAEADEGNAVGRVKLDPGVGTRVDDRQVGDAIEAIGADVDPVVIALAEVVDVVVAVAGRKE
jgi:hypothetical protein